MFCRSPELEYVGPVQLQDVTLLGVGGSQIAGFHKRGNNLRHPADDKVLAEYVKNAAMHSITHRTGIAIGTFDYRHHPAVSCRPEKFLEVHGKHLKVMLFRRNDDIIDVLLDRNQRAGFNVVVTSVGDKILDRLPRTWETLDFVKYDNTFARLELNMVGTKQIHEECIQVFQIIHEKALDVL